MFKRNKEILPCELSEYGKQMGFTNHVHRCELLMIYGGLNGICSYKCKSDDDDVCDECKHSRIVFLSDDGLHITGLDSEIGGD